MSLLRLKDKYGNVTEVPALVLKDNDTNPNRHAKFFSISDDGELSLKPEYRGATSNDTYTNSVSDMGAGVAGSLNSKLPVNLVIPEIVDDTAVDRLTSGMFLDNKIIESLVIPSTVHKIPEYFCGLAINLRNVYNTERIEIIEGHAFDSCRLEKAVFTNLKEISGDYAFLSCGSLVYADIGKIANIPAYTFARCANLTKLKTSEDVLSVGDCSFIGTFRLNNIDCISTLTSIGKIAFFMTKADYDWSSLNNCTFGDNATPYQLNPVDYWSNVVPTACENPLPTHLCQRDDRWVARSINNKFTYRNGCAWFSILHIYCGFHSLSLSSVTEFENIVNTIDPTIMSSYTGYPSDTTTILQSLGLKVTQYSTQSEESLRVLYTALKNGGYAIAQTGTPKGHAVSIYGVTEKGELMVADSECYYFYDTSKTFKYKLPIKQFVAQNAYILVVEE